MKQEQAIRLEETLGPPDTAALEDLRGRLRGEVVLPGDPSYEVARSVWNASIDRYPVLIARCAGPADVVTAVRFAREHDLLVAVRGGAHNVAGNATCDGGLVIDLSPMKGIRVDPDLRRAAVQPGTVWGDLDHETQPFGLAIPGGVVSSTGIAGFTLGGGFGWISRKYGLACDSLVAAEVVTAEGELTRASEDENPDLLWGLRGGGGNFGIVTSFEFALHPVGPELMFGLVFHPGDRAHEVFRFYRELLETAPVELTLLGALRLAPPAPFLPDKIHGKPVVAIGACYAGPLEEGEQVLRPIKEFGSPVADLIRPWSYLELQRLIDASWVPGFQNYWKAEYLTGLPDPAIDVLARYLEMVPFSLGDFKFLSLGGAVADVGENDTAYSFRDAPLIFNINARWSDPAESDLHIEWSRNLWTDMRPFSAGGVYVNFLGEEGSERVKAAYGERKWDRLVALKDKYDPTNFFRLNQNIPPTGV